MKSIVSQAPGIPSSNKIVIAKHQNEYQTLNAVMTFVHNKDRTQILQVIYNMCFELDFNEIMALLKSKRIWYQRAVNMPTKNAEAALENEGKFQPMSLSMVNPLPDTSDDLLALPAIPYEMFEFIEKYNAMRNRNPDSKDVFENKDEEMLNALYFLVEATKQTLDYEKLSQQLFAIALSALRLSRLAERRHTNNKQS